MYVCMDNPVNQVASVR